MSRPHCSAVMAIAVTAATVACSPAPLPVGHDFSTQKTLRSAAHWRVLAADTAEVVARANHTDADGVPVFVDPMDAAMPFATVFHQHLMTELVARDVPVVLRRGGARVVYTTVQPIAHGGGLPRPFPGSLTALGAGVFAVAEVADASAPGAAALGLAMADLWGGAAGEAPTLDGAAEVVVTVSVMDGPRIVLRQARTYYVDDKALAHYLATVPPPPLTGVGGDVGPAPVRAFDVVGAGEPPRPRTVSLSDVSRAPLDGPYTIYFPFDGHALDAAAEKVVADIARAQHNGGGAVVVASGHTDRAGAGGYNRTLSRKRAEAVARALEKAGVAEARVRVDYFGETRPAVTTPDGARNHQNRRVEVYLEGADARGRGRAGRPAS